MKVFVDFRHGLRITVENAEIYREPIQITSELFIHDGKREKILVYNKGARIVLFKGEQGCYLRSPRLWRKPAPVLLSIQ